MLPSLKAKIVAVLQPALPAVMMEFVFQAVIINSVAVAHAVIADVEDMMAQQELREQLALAILVPQALLVQRDHKVFVEMDVSF